MTDNKFIDFDAFFEAQEAESSEPLSFRYAGKTFLLPAQLPAAAALLMMQLKSKGSEKIIEDDDIRKLFVALLGKEQADSLFATGIGLTRLESILMWIFKNYMPESVVDSAADDSGNAKTPEKTGDTATS